MDEQNNISDPAEAPSRREFLKQSSVVAGGLLAMGSTASAAEILNQPGGREMAERERGSEKQGKKMTFEKFCRDYIPAHPELNLGTDDLSTTEFAKVAVEEGNKLGFKFSEAEIQAVLGEHRQARRKIADLGAAVKASANGTAMCYQGVMRTDEVLDADWLVIKGTSAKR